MEPAPKLSPTTMSAVSAWTRGYRTTDRPLGAPASWVYDDGRDRVIKPENMSLSGIDPADLIDAGASGLRDAPQELADRIRSIGTLARFKDYAINMLDDETSFKHASGGMTSFCITHQAGGNDYFDYELAALKPPTSIRDDLLDYSHRSALGCTHTGDQRERGHYLLHGITIPSKSSPGSCFFHLFIGYNRKKLIDLQSQRPMLTFVDDENKVLTMVPCVLVPTLVGTAMGMVLAVTRATPSGGWETTLLRTPITIDSVNTGENNRALRSACAAAFTMALNEKVRKPAADVPAAEVPAAEVPAAEVPAARVFADLTIVQAGLDVVGDIHFHDRPETAPFEPDRSLPPRFNVFAPCVAEGTTLSVMLGRASTSMEVAPRVSGTTRVHLDPTSNWCNADACTELVVAVVIAEMSPAADEIKSMSSMPNACFGIAHGASVLICRFGDTLRFYGCGAPDLWGIPSDLKFGAVLGAMPRMTGPMAPSLPRGAIVIEGEITSWDAAVAAAENATDISAMGNFVNAIRQQAAVTDVIGVNKLRKALLSKLCEMVDPLPVDLGERIAAKRMRRERNRMLAPFVEAIETIESRRAATTREGNVARSLRRGAIRENVRVATEMNRETMSEMYEGFEKVVCIGVDRIKLEVLLRAVSAGTDTNETWNAATGIASIPTRGELVMDGTTVSSIQDLDRGNHDMAVPAGVAAPSIPAHFTDPSGPSLIPLPMVPGSGSKCNWAERANEAPWATVRILLRSVIVNCRAGRSAALHPSNPKVALVIVKILLDAVSQLPPGMDDVRGGLMAWVATTMAAGTSPASTLFQLMGWGPNVDVPKDDQTWLVRSMVPFVDPGRRIKMLDRYILSRVIAPAVHPVKRSKDARSAAMGDVRNGMVPWQNEWCAAALGLEGAASWKDLLASAPETHRPAGSGRIFPKQWSINIMVPFAEHAANDTASDKGTAAAARTAAHFLWKRLGVTKYMDLGASSFEDAIRGAPEVDPAYHKAARRWWSGARAEVPTGDPRDHRLPPTAIERACLGAPDALVKKVMDLDRLISAGLVQMSVGQMGMEIAMGDTGLLNARARIVFKNELTL